MTAGGNLDFITSRIAELIKANKKMKSAKRNDLYSLAICCYLLVGDKDKRLFESLSDEDSLS